ncbi:hypothetical protein GQ42DRAFT_154635 [Ramicandelaber brevisporus]|nr:hypothetical protein GQ42DRAFT_154635 [Ramicandelaber brevisporus]
MKLHFAALATAAVLATSGSLTTAARFTMYSGKSMTGDARTYDYSLKSGYCTCVNVPDFGKRALSAHWDIENEGAIAFNTEPDCKGTSQTWSLRTRRPPIDFTQDKLQGAISSARVCYT